MNLEWTREDNYLVWMILDAFKITQAWGDPFKMHPILLFIIEKFNKSLPHGCWIKVHCGYKEKASKKNSYHCHGRAIDFHVVGCTFVEAESHLMKFLNESVILHGMEYKMISYVGIGIYPEWSDPGFHLDIRGKPNSWARIDSNYTTYTQGLEIAKNMNI